MDKKDVKIAYDSIYPTWDQRERMLQGITQKMEDEKMEENRFTGKPVEPRRWKLLPVAAAIALLLCGGIFIKRTVMPEETLTDPAAPIPSDTTYQEDLDKFREDLDKFQDAYEEQKQKEQEIIDRIILPTETHHPDTHHDHHH